MFAAEMNTSLRQQWIDLDVNWNSSEDDLSGLMQHSWIFHGGIFQSKLTNFVIYLINKMLIYSFDLFFIQLKWLMS